MSFVQVAARGHVSREPRRVRCKQPSCLHCRLKLIKLVAHQASCMRDTQLGAGQSRIVRAELTRPPGSLQENSCLTSIVTVESWAFLKGASSSRRLQASGLERSCGRRFSQDAPSVRAPETVTSGQGKTGRMQFSLGGCLCCSLQKRSRGHATCRSAGAERHIHRHTQRTGCSAMFHQNREKSDCRKRP